MPSVFVMMPFDEHSGPVYSEFFKPVLEEAGFEVNRADDFESQQNILQDILRGITTSNLIIADLTGNNPNVFYELGLAHALKIPVILATQSIEEVPFDLRSYRVLEYSRDFSRIGEARDRLSRYATAFLAAELPIGSPVTDFLRDNPLPEQGFASGSTSPDGGDSDTVAVEFRQLPVGVQPTDTDQRGFLDHLVDVNEGYNRVTDVTLTLSDSMQSLGGYILTATDEVTQITANPNSLSAAAAVAVCRRLARRIGSFAADVSVANVVFSSVLDETEESLELLVSTARENVDADDPDYAENIMQLRDLLVQARLARESILTFADVMDELPRVERELNSQTARSSREVRVLANHLDRMIGSITRAVNAAGLAS